MKFLEEFIFFWGTHDRLVPNPLNLAQGLRQENVLSTLLFNVVLEVIVRRANLQTTGTIYNKETQLLAYTDDIDIVGRSQSAVRDAYLALEREAA
jgi:hypothetical protein